MFSFHILSMELVTANIYGILRAFEAMQQGPDRGTSTVLLYGRRFCPLHGAQPDFMSRKQGAGGARTPQGCGPLRGRLRRCGSSIIPQLSTLPFRGPRTHPDSESGRLPDSCIVATQGPMGDLGEVCVVRNVSMIVCAVF